MTVLIMPVDPDANREVPGNQRIQVMVNIRAEVLDPEIARRRANVWLLENAGNLLGAERPELILGDQLLWRFEVTLGIPDLGQPGSGDVYRVGHILVDALTSEIQSTDTLVEELRRNAASVAR